MDLQQSLESSLLIEDVPPPGNRRVAVIIGRFNPPTKGHYALINEVKAFIRKNKDLRLDASPVVMVIGGSKADTDRARNPLTTEQRIQFMTASGNANGVKFLSAPNAFAALAAVREAGFEPIAIAAGPDRADDYLRILDKHFLDTDGKQVKHHKIMLDRDDSAIETTKGAKKSAVDQALDQLQKNGNLDTEQVSASVVRATVEHDMFPEFMKLTGLEHKEALAKTMFKAVKAGMKE
jgi:hypothetical protein